MATPTGRSSRRSIGFRVCPKPACVCAQDFFFKLGNKNLEGGFGKPKAPFWARPASVLLGAAYPEAEEKLASEDEEFAYWKEKYDRSKKSATRTGACMP